MVFNILSDPEELERMCLNKPSFNLARIINESPTMKKLIDLGVNLSQWEKWGKVTSPIRHPRGGGLHLPISAL
jgi:hypothetical protein